MNMPRIRQFTLPPPPPPPPEKTKRNFRIVLIVLILIALILIPVILIYSGILPALFKPPTPQVTPTPTPTPQGALNLVTSDKVQVLTETVGATGETIQVTDSSNPLYGLRINVPEAATSEQIQFDISYASITSVSGLPQNASVASKMISITTSGSTQWNQFKMFDKAVEVTLPYDKAVDDDNSIVRFYWYDRENGKLDSSGFLSQNKIANTITFLTASFSDFVAISLDLTISELTGWGYTVDTGFRPATDGWFIPNYGSYLSPGGICLGMTSFAKWYFAYIKGATGIGLYDKYIEGNPSEWRDDATAIQLATRAHLGTSGIWSSLTTEERNWALANAREVALSWIHGMIVTDEPQLIGLKTRYVDGTWAQGGHAILTYEYSNGMFEIYDPNFPGSVPGTRMRQIPFSYTNGFNETYVSGLSRTDRLIFNVFYHAGSKMAADPKAYTGIYLSAEKHFEDDIVFPTVTLTSEHTNPEGTTPEDTDGDGIRDTPNNKAVISGTITGGQRPLNSTLIFVSNQKFTVRVENGEFSQEVPLYNGDNDVIVLATDENTFTNWAGFLRDTIRCNATVASMTITLTWGQDNSDVDLHVLEPEPSGRHIYYDNKGYTGGNPYLDMDNTKGYGPEHYYATEDMTLPGSTSLYGTYRVRVEYYADHSGAEQTQPIMWHLNVRYLAFKDPNTGQEFWYEESRSGVLTVADETNTDDFFNDSPAWSSIWIIEYKQPNPQDYGIPPPPQNQLP